MTHALDLGGSREDRQIYIGITMDLGPGPDRTGTDHQGSIHSGWVRDRHKEDTAIQTLAIYGGTTLGPHGYGSLESSI